MVRGWNAELLMGQTVYILALISFVLIVLVLTILIVDFNKKKMASSFSNGVGNKMTQFGFVTF